MVTCCRSTLLSSVLLSGWMATVCLFLVLHSDVSAEGRKVRRSKAIVRLDLTKGVLKSRIRRYRRKHNKLYLKISVGKVDVTRIEALRDRLDRLSDRIDSHIERLDRILDRIDALRELLESRRNPSLNPDVDDTAPDGRSDDPAPPVPEGMPSDFPDITINPPFEAPSMPEKEAKKDGCQVSVDTSFTKVPPDFDVTVTMKVWLRNGATLTEIASESRLITAGELAVEPISTQVSPESLENPGIPEVTVVYTMNGQDSPLMTGILDKESCELTPQEVPDSGSNPPTISSPKAPPPPEIPNAISVSTSQELIDAVQRGAPEIKITSGVFEIPAPLSLKEGMKLVGSGTTLTILRPSSSWTSAMSNLPDGDGPGGYLMTVIKGADVVISNMTLEGPSILGGVYAEDSPGLDIGLIKFGDFGWSGVRGQLMSNLKIHDSVFDNSGRKHKDQTPGAIFLNFTSDSEFWNNRFEPKKDDRHLFGIKGEQLINSRIHHNTILIDFSIEFPFFNDENNEIDHNYLFGTVSIPKFAGGPELGNIYSFDIHHNYFVQSYSIELARNNLMVRNNLFDTTVDNDHGNLMSDFGAEDTPGPLEFINNNVRNPGRGIFWSDAKHSNITISHNHIISETTTRPDGFVGLSSKSDFSTIMVSNNIIENTERSPRPLFRNLESSSAIIENNLLENVSDTSNYTNPQTGEIQGPTEPVVFSCGAYGEYSVNGWTIRGGR